MFFEFIDSPFSEICYVPTLKYKIECDGRLANDSCLEIPADDVLSHTHFVLDNLRYRKLQNYHETDDEIFKSSKCAHIIFNKITYIFSKEKYSTYLDKICDAFELLLNCDSMRERLITEFYHVCRKNPVRRTFAEFHKIMMQILLRINPIFKNIYDAYSYVVMSLSDKNKLFKDSKKHYLQKQRIQIIIALGYNLKQYNMLSYNNDIERELVRQWLKSPLITNCEKYFINSSFNNLLDILERNIVDQLYHYIDDIYTIVDNYSDRFLEYIGIICDSSDIRPTYRYDNDIRPEQLTLIKECLSYKQTEDERRFEQFGQHCDIIYNIKTRK